MNDDPHLSVDGYKVTSDGYMISQQNLDEGPYLKSLMRPANGQGDVEVLTTTKMLNPKTCFSIEPADAEVAGIVISAGDLPEEYQDFEGSDGYVYSLAEDQEYSLEIKASGEAWNPHSEEVEETVLTQEFEFQTPVEEFLRQAE